MQRRQVTTLGLALALLHGSLLAQTASEETVAYFRQNCTSCHTIGGGRLAGPDLKDVTKRRELAWLVPFILNPKGIIDSGDPYAQQLLQEARGVYMTPVPGITRERATKLVALIEIESALEESQFAGLQISDRPLTDLDVARGQALFTGGQDFENGAPACISCHTTNQVGMLGGGLLGPDLTSAYARLEGRKALSAWLSAPPSLVMQPVFRNQPLDGEEILALVAYLKNTAETGEADSKPVRVEFTLAGCAVAAVILVLFDFFWRNRFRDVRETIVEQSRL